ncbi:hypothetical protein [Streptomyces iconiensis]|uniref:Uncharacterized protein n=1 Tax=Streptomyces iconiensis TaxID=1384038 RepID=A0ABT6ZTP5_9ACTN|nr:hypothetical protein [Streptomyces iconiensis]MDJ1132442.1 hypothetical protein [Streptomyces iconiensis]
MVETPMTPERWAEIRSLDLLALMPERAAAVMGVALRDLIDEVERSRAEVEDLEQERDKLIRWHAEDERTAAARRATITHLRAELAARPTREAVLREAKNVLMAHADRVDGSGLRREWRKAASVLGERADAAGRGAS